MPQLPFQTHQQAASFAAAVGFGESFFGSGQLAALVEQYKAERGLDFDTMAVEVTLQDRSAFLVTHVRVAARYIVFYTEEDEHICVPNHEVAKVRITRRATPKPDRQLGFSVERIDESADSPS